MRELWYIGKSGQQIYLNDLVAERTWTLFRGIDFNYENQLKVVQYGAESLNKYKALFVGFDPKTYQDVMYEADISMNYFDKRYNLPSMLNFDDQDYLLGYRGEDFRN